MHLKLKATALVSILKTLKHPACTEMEKNVLNNHFNTNPVNLEKKQGKPHPLVFTKVQKILLQVWDRSELLE